MSFFSKLTKELAELSKKKQYEVDELKDLLRGRGVKDAEMEFSGMNQRLDDIIGTIGRDDAQRLDRLRTDYYDFEDVPNKTFRSYTLADNPYGDNNYRELLLTHSTKPGVDRSYTEHFPFAGDYLAHARVIDDVIDGQPVLAAQELQSDVLGQALQRGRQGGILDLDADTKDVLNAIDADLPRINPTAPRTYEEYNRRALSHADEILMETGVDINTMPVDDDQISGLIRYGEVQDARGIIADEGPQYFPNKKNYYQRTVERLLDVAEKEGKDLVVPLKEANPGDISLIDTKLARSDNIQQRVYDPDKGAVPKALKRVAREQDMEYDTVAKDGVMYGRIKRGDKKKKPTELYDLGAGLLTAESIRQMYGNDDG